ncbi:GNAT family N-acetyltransferase [Rasiella sp. SM2506]|uniref:GNAT family N-acetyltransferase n=1 Tax=Rasiella sp. SM2506 TaxID=3423914 RepID=UPI003D798410
MKIVTLETERLLLRQIEVTDAPFFYELLNSEGWLKYIGDRNIKTIADAERQIIEKYIPGYTKYGYGSYIVIDKASKMAVGTCGMYQRDNLNHPDIGFAFLPQFIGKGYGYEASNAVLHYAKNTLNICKVLAFTVPHNSASIKLLEKLGLKNAGDYFFEGEPEPLLLFEITL